MNFYGEVHLEISQAREWKTRLVRVPAVEQVEQCHGDDLEIKGEAPVSQVIKVILDPLGDGSIAAPSVHLSPAGDSGLESVARVIAIELLQKLFHKVRTFGPGPDDAHVAFQHIDELWEFIEIRFAQERAEGCTPGIVGTRPDSVALLLAGNLHRAELVHAEQAAV